MSKSSSSSVLEVAPASWPPLPYHPLRWRWTRRRHLASRCAAAALPRPAAWALPFTPPGAFFFCSFAGPLHLPSFLVPWRAPRPYVMLRTAATRGGAALRRFAADGGGSARGALFPAGASASRSVSRAALPSAAGVAANEALATEAAVRVVAGEVSPQQLTVDEAARFRADREAQKSIKNFTLNFGPQHPAGTCWRCRWEGRPHRRAPAGSWAFWVAAGLATCGWLFVCGWMLLSCPMYGESTAPRAVTLCAVDWGTHVATLLFPRTLLLLAWLPPSRSTMSSCTSLFCCPNLCSMLLLRARSCIFGWVRADLPAWLTPFVEPCVTTDFPPVCASLPWVSGCVGWVCLCAARGVASGS